MTEDIKGEIEFQRDLYNLLEGIGYSVYADKQRPSIDWYPKTFTGARMKPDLIVFHDGIPHRNSHKGYKVEPLPNPIGVEIKLDNGINNITKGMYYQMERKYKNLEYIVHGKSWVGKIPLLCLTTDAAIKRGVVYGNGITEGMESTFFIERMLWRFDMGLIISGSQREYKPETPCNYISSRRPNAIYISYDNESIEICKK